MPKTQVLAEATFVVVDIETTGGVAGKHAITEIGAVKIQGGQIVDRFTTLINPQQDIPPFIQNLTGIRPDMVADAPTIDEVMPGFWLFLGDAIFVAHHVPFDFRFMDRATKNLLGSGLSNPQVCTCRLAKKLLPGLKRKNLGAVASHLGITIENRHRAMGDAEATAQVMLAYLDLLAEIDITTLAALQKFDKQGQKRYGNVVLPFPEHKLSEFPQNPGVYMMRDHKGDLLYIGKAKNIRKRLKSYFSNLTRLPNKVQELVPQIHDIEVHVLGSELEALLEESYLIKKHQPYYNRQIKNYRSFPFLKITVQSPFPQLLVTRDISQDDALYFGPYQRKRSLLAMIETLGRVFQLRTCTDAVFKKHVLLNQSCVLHQIGNCSGPCALQITPELYRERVEEIVGFLEGKVSEATDKLIAERDSYAETMAFEMAQRVQDRLMQLLRLQASTRHLTQAVHHNHMVIILPDRAPPRRLILYILKGRPVYKQVFDPEHDSLDSILDRIQTLQNMLALSTQHKRDVIEQIELEEVRIIAHWLKYLQPDPVAHHFDLTRPFAELAGEIRKHFMLTNTLAESLPETQHLASFEEEGWSREAFY